jgi:hypothetical protein
MRTQTHSLSESRSRRVSFSMMGVDLFAVEADVDRVVVVQHAQLRPFGRLTAVERRLLRERIGRGPRLPDGIVETAVDQRRFGA